MSNKSPETAKSNDGKTEVPLNTWLPDDDGLGRVMYTRETPVNFCPDKHQFNRKFECEKCPFVFVGFRANMHIFKDDAIFERKSRNDLGRRLA